MSRGESTPASPALKELVSEAAVSAATCWALLFQVIPSEIRSLNATRSDDCAFRSPAPAAHYQPSAVLGSNCFNKLPLAS
jgi:hypothetical protein